MNSITNCSVLNNEVRMPYLGLGVYLSKDGKEVINAVNWAFEAGYRHIDTASIYNNESGVGEAVNSSNIGREEIFVVSKLWNADQGYDSALKAYDESLKRLNLEYLDLYLIHWPVIGKYKDSWKALEKIYKEGRVRAIGISNFLSHQLNDLIESVEIMPMVNQMEYHPYLQQNELRSLCRQNKIQYESWSPLMQGKIFAIDELKTIASRYNKTLAQLVIRWNLQNEVICIPKSSKKHRIIENADVFDFVITENDMKLINSLDKNIRVGPDPDNFDF